MCLKSHVICFLRQWLNYIGTVYLLQESWLSRSELPMLCNVHNDFTGFGVSSINEEEHLLTGRPFGGTATLWRKSFNKFCSIKTYDCDRIIGIEFVRNPFSTLFLCVYLPYDCSDNHDDYMFYLSK